MARREPSEVMEGLLLGTAIGDALGLPFEGLGARTIARWNPSFDRYHLLGPLGFVSDDTEQSALLLESLLRGRGEHRVDPNPSRPRYGDVPRATSVAASRIHATCSGGISGGAALDAGTSRPVTWR